MSLQWKYENENRKLKKISGRVSQIGREDGGWSIE